MGGVSVNSLCQQDGLFALSVNSIYSLSQIAAAIIYIFSLFDDLGNVLSYEHFMTVHDFPIPFKEYNTVLRAIPTGLMHLVKGHILYPDKDIKESALLQGGIGIYDK